MDQSDNWQVELRGAPQSDIVGKGGICLRSRYSHMERVWRGVPSIEHHTTSRIQYDGIR
jgi:hypothetical protein